MRKTEDFWRLAARQDVSAKREAMRKGGGGTLKDRIKGTREYMLRLTWWKGASKAVTKGTFRLSGKGGR